MMPRLLCENVCCKFCKELPEKMYAPNPSGGISARTGISSLPAAPPRPTSAGLWARQRSRLFERLGLRRPFQPPSYLPGRENQSHVSFRSAKWKCEQLLGSRNEMLKLYEHFLPPMFACLSLWKNICDQRVTKLNANGSSSQLSSSFLVCLAVAHVSKFNAKNRTDQLWTSTGGSTKNMRKSCSEKPKNTAEKLFRKTENHCGKAIQKSHAEKA